MPHEIAIDRFGRLVIPKVVREHHRLEAGSKLTLVDREDHLVLMPSRPEPRLVERDGLLVVMGGEPTDLPDHRMLREERLEHLTGSK